MPKRIFLSYRREDAAGHAGRVGARLISEFGKKKIFIDVDNIAAGFDFREQLTAELASCGALLAVIGPRWLGQDEHGGRRIDNPNDYVRIEIGTALQRRIPVIPVLVDEARIPSADVLPEDLQDLSFRIGRDLRNTSFDADMDRLLGDLKKALINAEVEALLSSIPRGLSISGYLFAFLIWLIWSFLGFVFLFLGSGLAYQFGKQLGIAQGSWLEWLLGLALIAFTLLVMLALAKWFRTTTIRGEVAVIAFLSIVMSFCSLGFIMTLTGGDRLPLPHWLPVITLAVIYLFFTALLLLGRRRAGLSLWLARSSHP